jgi:hypothetical protein
LTEHILGGKMTTSYGAKAWHLNLGQQLQLLTHAVYAPDAWQARRCVDFLKGSAVSEVLDPVPPSSVVEKNPHALVNWQVDAVENSSAILSSGLGSVTEQIARLGDRFSNGESISRILERHGITPELISESSDVGFFDRGDVQDFLDSLEVAHDNSWVADVFRQDIDVGVYFGDYTDLAVNVWRMPTLEIPTEIPDYEFAGTVETAMISRGVKLQNIYIVDELAEELYLVTDVLSRLDAKTARVYWMTIADMVNRFGSNAEYVRGVLQAILAQIADVISEKEGSFIKGVTPKPAYAL